MFLRPARYADWTAACVTRKKAWVAATRARWDWSTASAGLVTLSATASVGIGRRRGGDSISSGEGGRGLEVAGRQGAEPMVCQPASAFASTTGDG